jgi:hypothetical protein
MELPTLELAQLQREDERNRSQADQIDAQRARLRAQDVEIARLDREMKRPLRATCGSDCGVSFQWGWGHSP